MKIIDPQTAVLTNVEVLAHITANPPRRAPNPPPNSRNWVPSPDLRDHNTVIKEIQNYITRLSPHLLSYPRYTHDDTNNTTTTSQQPQPHVDSTLAQSQTQTQPPVLPTVQRKTPTPMDIALHDLIARLKPFGLTKGEVLMIVNLGIGVGGNNPSASAAEDDGEGMDVDGAEAGGGEGEGEGGEQLAEEDYGSLALLDTVIEEREERLGNEEVVEVLKIIRETLGSGSASASGEGLLQGQESQPDLTIVQETGMRGH